MCAILCRLAAGYKAGSRPTPFPWVQVWPQFVATDAGQRLDGQYPLGGDRVTGNPSRNATLGFQTQCAGEGRLTADRIASS